MKATICIVVHYVGDLYSTPALYWSERKAFGVPEVLNNYDACYPSPVKSDIDPDEWISRANTYKDYVYLTLDTNSVPSWEFVLNLDFESALNLYTKRLKAAKRQEKVNTMLSVFSRLPLLRKFL